MAEWTLIGKSRILLSTISYWTPTYTINYSSISEHHSIRVQPQDQGCPQPAQVKTDTHWYCILSISYWTPIRNQDSQGRMNTHWW